MLNDELPSWRVMLALPALLLIGCANTPPVSLPPVVAPPAIPALPQAARQPAAPAWCSPSCSSALSIELSSWQRGLTKLTPPGLPASAPTVP